MNLFERYVQAMRDLPEGHLTEADFAPFELDCDRDIKIFYAPFDWIKNLSARVVICGITPGRNSMLLALRTSAAALRAGATNENASREGKRTGSFSNMRKNLVARMDVVGLHTALGLDSTARLFLERADMLHTTSVIRYPVFKNGKNYGGYSPRMTRHPLLRRYIEEHLKPEVQKFPKAMFVPNGPAVAEALLVTGLDERRCLVGFPHAQRSWRKRSGRNI